MFSDFLSKENELCFIMTGAMNKAEFSKLRKKFAENSIEELIELLSAEDLQTQIFCRNVSARCDFDLTEFQTGEFAGRKRKSHRRMARMAQRKRREI